MRTKLMCAYRNYIEQTYFLACVALAVLIAFVSIKPDLDAWMASLWLVDYPGEFIKRGFVGEIIELFGTYFYDLNMLTALAKANIFVYAIALAIFSFVFYKRNPAIGLGLIVAGFSIQQFSYDLGRFDQLNQFITLIAIFFLAYFRSLLSVLLVTALSFLMLFIHEASALLNIPVVFVACFFMFKDSSDTRLFPFIYLLLCVLAFVAVVIFGGLDKQSFHEWDIYMQEKDVEFTLDKNALIVLDTSFSENVRMSIERLMKKETISRLARVLMVSIFTIVIMVLAFSKALKKRRFYAFLILLPTVSIIPMFFLGIDFYRWIAGMQLNFFIVLGVFLWVESDVQLEINRKIISAWILFSLYTGPFGISVALPDRNRALEGLISLF